MHAFGAKKPSRFMFWLRFLWHAIRLHEVSVMRRPYRSWHCGTCGLGEIVP